MTFNVLLLITNMIPKLVKSMITVVCLMSKLNLLLVTLFLVSFGQPKLVYAKTIQIKVLLVILRIVMEFPLLLTRNVNVKRKYFLSFLSVYGYRMSLNAWPLVLNILHMEIQKIKERILLELPIIPMEIETMERIVMIGKKERTVLL